MKTKNRKIKLQSLESFKREMVNKSLQGNIVGGQSKKQTIDVDTDKGGVIHCDHINTDTTPKEIGASWDITVDPFA